MKIKQILTLSINVVFLILITACTSTDPVRVEQDFGNSVRHMISSQIYDPEAAMHPAADPPTEFDGNKGVEVLKTYRSDTAKPQQIEKPISINIGR